jgi:hypothetical protein
MLNDVIECPICLNDINNNEGIIIPECCNNPVHLKCIMDWYEKNNRNNVCFICQQVNQFSKDIHLNPPEKEIEIRENLLENNNSEENKKCIKIWLCGTILGTYIRYYYVGYMFVKVKFFFLTFLFHFLNF